MRQNIAVYFLKLSDMKKKQYFIFILFAIFILKFSTFFIFFRKNQNTMEADPALLNITTDDVSYQPGEEVKIVFHNSGPYVWRFGDGNRPYSIVRLVAGDDPIPVRLLDSPCTEESLPAAPVAYRVAIRGTETLSWSQKESWCDTSVSPPVVVEKQVLPGTYRVVTKSWKEDGSEQRVIYSNEFTIGSSDS